MKERRVRSLERPRPDVQPLGGMELALEVEGRARPALLHQRDAFLDPQPRVGALGPERLVVLERAAASDADVEPSTGHDVERGELLGEIDRMMERQQAHAHPEAERGRAGGHERREHRWRRTEAVIAEVVLGDPHRVIAERFGGQHLLEGGIVDGPLAPRVVPLHEKEEPEVHGARHHSSMW